MENEGLESSVLIMEAKEKIQESQQMMKLNEEKLLDKISQLEYEIIELKEAKNQMFPSEYVEELQVKVIILFQ